MREPAPHVSPLALLLFELCFRPFQRLRLHTVVYLPTSLRVPEDRPVVMMANHVSWWDGFLLRDLHRELAPERPLFTLMLADELRRYPFFRSLGAVAIATRTGAVRRALRDLERLRQRDPRFVLSFFPQGRIGPSWERPLRFQRGIELLLERLAPCSVLPVALHVEPLNRVRPTAFVSPGAALSVGGRVRVAELEAVLRSQLDELLAHVAEHSANATRHRPHVPPLGRALDARLRRPSTSG